MDTAGMKRLFALAILMAATLPAASAAAAPPPIRHVWVIQLENTSYAESFGPTSKAPYFSRDLPAQGNLLTQFYGITHFSLGNYIAMLSGQPSNMDTQFDCQRFSSFNGAGTTPDGAAIGQGCVYPPAVKTLPDQLEAKGLSWRGYMQDMANGPGADTCRHPAVDAQDTTQTAKVGDQYAVRHNPFVYFRSIIDNQARCDANVVDFARLGEDLKSAATTPNFNFITPNLCEDGHDEPTCVDGRPGGLMAADVFLQRTVPGIMASPAFKADGLILVTFDEAEATGPMADSSACCNQPSGPNTANPGLTKPGPGGGRIGAIALSRFVKPGTTSTVPYNHYSFLRSMEDLFGIGEHLGFANQMGLASFGGDVYTQPDGATQLPLPGMTPKPPSAAPKQTCTTTRVRGTKVKRGSLVRAVTVSDPIQGKRIVQVSVAHAARLTVTVKAKGMSARTLTRNKRVRACRAYRFTLPAGVRRIGTLRVTARLPSGTEHRSARYR